jgi:hypothetical protein
MYDSQDKPNKNANNNVDVLYKIWLGVSPTDGTPWSKILCCWPEN